MPTRSLFAPFCAVVLPSAASLGQSDHAPAYESYLAHVAAAESALRLGEMNAMRRWLDGAPAEHRRFEWSWLDARSDESVARFDAGASALATLDVAPDGERVVTGATDGSIAVFDLAGGRELARMAGHAGEIYCVRFDHAGERVVSAAHDRKVKIWNARSGELLLTFERHGYPVGAAAFGPDDELVASCAYERPPGTVVGTVHVWNASNGDVLETLEGGRKPLSSLAWSPDGTSVAAGSWDFCVFAWTLGSGELPRSYAVPDEGLYNAVDAVAFSPDGTRLVAGSKDMTARMWDVESGAELAAFRGHTNQVAAVAFSPDGTLVATGSFDQTVRLWNARDGSAAGVLRGHRGAVRGLAFPPAGGTLVSASTDRSVRSWDTSTSWYGGVERRASSACYAVAFDRLETRLAICGYDGRVALWDVATWEEIASWQAHPAGSSCHMLAFDTSGRRLYSGSHDGTVAIWDSSTLAEQGRLVHEKGLECFALSPDGTRLAVAQTDGKIWMWDLESREHLFTFTGHADVVHDLAFRSDGVEVASASRDRTARIFAARDGEELGALSHETDVRCVLYLPGGGTLITADGAGRVRSWDTVHGAPTLLHEGENAWNRLALSPDGSRIAAAARHATLIDPGGRAAVAALRPHRDTIWNLAFAPSGKRLATCSWDGTFAISDTRPLGERLAERAAVLSAAAPARAWIDAELAAGGTLQAVADALRSDAELAPAERTARRNALTRAAAAGL